MANYQMNLEVLKSYEEEFKNEKFDFNNKSYNTFLSSYLNNCSNSYVRQMASKVNDLYNLTKKGYENTDKWWNDYNTNLEGLENALSNSSRSGNITESSIRNYVISNLSNPDDYVNNLTGSITSLSALGIENFSFINSVNVQEPGEFSSVLASNSLFAEVFSYDGLAMNYFESTGALTFSDLNLSNILSLIACTYIDVMVRTNATLVSTLIWAIGGIGQVIEWIIDVIIIAFAAVSSVITGVVDLCAWINKLITGEDFESATVEIWDATMAMVADKKVIGLVDKLFEETEFGNIIKETSFFYETTKTIGEGLGELIGIVGITVLTFGVGGAVAGSSAAAGGTAGAVASGAAATTATTATASTFSLATVKTLLIKGIPAAITGFGKGAEKSWGEGASLFEGLGFASLTALWEGLQMSAGLAINATKPVSAITSKLGKTISPKKLNIFDSFGRIFLDAGDNAAEGFVQPLLQTSYRDESYKELFKESGGWGNVGIQFILGGALSFLGETGNLGKAFNNTGAKVSETDNILSSKFTNSLDQISNNNKTNIFGIPFVSHAEMVPNIGNSVFSFLGLKKILKNGSLDSNSVSKSISQNVSVDELLDDYAKHINFYNSSNVSLKKFLEDYGIDYSLNEKKYNDLLIAKLNNKEMIKFSETFKSPKLYMYSKLDEINIRYQNDVNVKNIYNKYQLLKKQSSSYETSAYNMYKELEPYLTVSEKETIYHMFTDFDSPINLYSDVDKAAIQLFTKAFGPPLAAYNRHAVTKYGGVYYDGTKLSSIDSNYKYALSNYGADKNVKTLLGSYDTITFNKIMDDIISKSPQLKEDMVVYRGCDSIYFNGNEVNAFNVGTRFNDRAHVSTSITNIAAHNHSIMMEIHIPKGTKAAYLEEFTGVKNYCQQEVLLARNSCFQISDVPVVDNLGRLHLKVDLIL